MGRGWDDSVCASVSPEEGSPETALLPSPARNLHIASPPSSLEEAVPSSSSEDPRVGSAQLCWGCADLYLCWVDVRAMVVSLLSLLSLGSSSPVQILPRSEPTSSGRSCPGGLSQAPQTQTVKSSSSPTPGLHAPSGSAMFQLEP